MSEGHFQHSYDFDGGASLNIKRKELYVIRNTKGEEIDADANLKALFHYFDDWIAGRIRLYLREEYTEDTIENEVNFGKLVESD